MLFHCLALVSVLAWEPMPKTLTFDVNGTRREAVVVVPATPPPSTGFPVVFAFHGHGGTAQSSLRKFAIHRHWPEALVVYPQGETGVVGITDPQGKKSGWQKNPGELADRDLLFFDAMLAKLTNEYKIDAKRIHAMGHSNGSRFVCVLWNQRGDKLASLATSGGQAGLLAEKAPVLPLFMIAGQADPLVKFDGQKRTIDKIKEKYRTDAATAETRGHFRRETNADGIEIVTYLHPGGHEFPEVVIPEMVKFFKKHPKR